MNDKDHQNDRNLVCVFFPGVVKNDDKAIQCLGGIKNISQIYTQSGKKRLGLSFQPENPYIKKIYADYTKTAGVLLKVKVKKRKENGEVKREVTSTSIVGCVKNMFKFESMSDFQYTPVQTDSGTPQCVLEQILPTGLDDHNYILGSSPLFISPSHFTRSDRPIMYAYTEKKYQNKASLLPDDDFHHRIRTDRAVPVSRYSFNLTDEFPKAPYDYYVKWKNAKCAALPQMKSDFELVEKYFNDRPICSLNWLRYHTKVKVAYLKFMLPYFAFYLKDGPWRMLWVKYGYDPRKDSNSRVYQTLDFRIRHQAGVYTMVTTRDRSMGGKRSERAPRRTDDAIDALPEAAVTFRPGMVPSQRQIFYQYIDVEIPEVQALARAAPPPGYLCHAKRGWLPADAALICRDIIFKHIKETLLATNTDLKIEERSSDEGESSDGEDDTSTAMDLD